MSIKNGTRIRNVTVLKITIVVLSLVLYFGNMFTFNTSEIVDIICIVTFPCLDVAAILAIVAFLIPLNSGISVMYIYGYAILMLLLKKKGANIRVVVATLGTFAYELLMLLFVPEGKGNFESIIIYTCTVFLLLYMLYTKDADYKLCCYTYVFGTVVLLLAVVTTAIQSTSLEAVLGGDVRLGAYEDVEQLGGRVAVLTENANSFGYYALVSIVLSFSLLKETQAYEKILLVLSLIIGIVIGLFSVSRTFLLVMIAGILLIFLFKYKFKQKIVVALVLCGILYIGMPFLLDNTGIYDAFLRRFNDKSAASASGRPDVFMEYMRFLWNNPERLLFGTGATFYRYVCQTNNSAHCGIQQILISYGIMGFVPFVYLLVKPIFSYFKEHRFSFEKIIPLVCVIVFTQTIQFLNPFNLMLPYAVAAMYMKMPTKDGRK